jgi:plasmid maintenance system antidote protein VapI
MIELLATLVEQYEIRQGYVAPVLSPRDRLAGLLEARHMTQTGLSLAAGVPRTAINEVLAGKRTVRRTNVVRLAKFFGVPVEELMAGNGGAGCAKLKQA